MESCPRVYYQMGVYPDFDARITDWVSEQSSVVDLNKLAGRLTNERDAERGSLGEGLSEPMTRR